MPIQKDQIEMMKRIQNEMRNSLKEKVKELEATKIRIEEENEKLQIDRYGYEMFEVRTSDCLGCGSLDDTDGDGLPHVPDGEPTKRREV